MGSPPLTTRGLIERDFEQVADFVDRGIQIALQVQTKAGSNKMPDFRNTLAKTEDFPQIEKMKQDVVAFARQFPVVGFKAEGMKVR